MRGSSQARMSLWARRGGVCSRRPASAARLGECAQGAGWRRATLDAGRARLHRGECCAAALRPLRQRPTRQRAYRERSQQQHPSVLRARLAATDSPRKFGQFQSRRFSQVLAAFYSAFSGFFIDISVWGSGWAKWFVRSGWAKRRSCEPPLACSVACSKLARRSPRFATHHYAVYMYPVLSPPRHSREKGQKLLRLIVSRAWWASASVGARCTRSPLGQRKSKCSLDSLVNLRTHAVHR